MELVCIDCHLPRDKGNRRCRSCYLKFKRTEAKDRYKRTEGKRTMYTLVCVACKSTFSSSRKTTLLCPSCRALMKLLAKEDFVDNNYVYSGYSYEGKKQTLLEHRILTEKLLRRKLSSNEVVHHLDGNCQNNIVTNLIVLSRKDHINLHRYLNFQRVIFVRAQEEEQYWSIRNPITMAWLETTKTNVIKVWEINQVAS
jgi:hypothetical protein